MDFRLFFIAIAFLGGLTASSRALAIESPVALMQSEPTRARTIEGLRLIDRGRWEEGREKLAGTRDPLAAKLYYWLAFRGSSQSPGYSQLTQFIRANPSWPGLRDLRKRAERDMPGALSAQAVVEWFADYPPETTKGVDRYIAALLAMGRTDQARAFLADWWATATLSRDDQRIIFRKYHAHLTLNAHRRRLDNILFAGQYDNARAIARVLENGYPALAEARIALAEGNGNVDALIAKIPAGLQGDAGLMYERLRWRRKKDLNIEALQILNSPPRADLVENKGAWWKERHIMIRRMLEKRQYETAYTLARKHLQSEGADFADAEWVAGWIALQFLNKPTNAYQHFERLYAAVQTPISKGRAAYWAGLAAKKMGSPELSGSWFTRAAAFKTVYYGQLAAAELGRLGELPSAAPPVLTAQDQQSFEAHELMQAAALFDRAGMKTYAGQFLQAFVSAEDNAKAFRFAAERASRMGNYFDAVKIAKSAARKGFFLTVQDYPVITDMVANVPVEWALVHAIIRQESMFDFNAVSPAGALGLMQLMPATAKEVARKNGWGHQTSWLTQKPPHNIRLGSAYLAQMLERFGGSYPLAIAAYNAGPARVDEWLETFGDPRLGQVEWLDWIELIPFSETRNYVQRVLEAVYVYRLRLKDHQKASVLPPIHVALQSRY